MTQKERLIKLIVEAVYKNGEICRVMVSDTERILDRIW